MRSGKKNSNLTLILINFHRLILEMWVAYNCSKLWHEFQVNFLDFLKTRYTSLNNRTCHPILTHFLGMNIIDLIETDVHIQVCLGLYLWAQCYPAFHNWCNLMQHHDKETNIPFSWGCLCDCPTTTEYCTHPGTAMSVAWLYECWKVG